MNDGFQADPLRCTLAGMRAELDGMIEREIDRLLGLCVTPREPASPAMRANVLRPTPGAPLAGVLDTPTVRATGMPPVTTGGHTPAGDTRIGEDGTGDAGSRLEALARRLEGRIRRPRGDAVESMPAAQTGDTFSPGGP